MILLFLALTGCPRPPPQLDRVLLVSPDPPYTTDAWQEDRLMLSLTARQAVTVRLGINSQLKPVVGYVDARWDGLTWVYWGGPSAIDAEGRWRLLGSDALRAGRTDGPDTLTVEELASGLTGPVLVILDTCAGGGDRGVGVHLSQGREAKPLQLPDGVVVWSAAAPDGRCYTVEPGMGLFTSLVVQALDGAANEGGMQGDEVITLSEASTWVRAESMARTVGAAAPMVYGDPSFLKAPLARHDGVPMPNFWGDTPRFPKLVKAMDARRAELARLQARSAEVLERIESDRALYEHHPLDERLWDLRYGANDEVAVQAMLLSVRLNTAVAQAGASAPPLAFDFDQATNWCYDVGSAAQEAAYARDLAFGEASRLSAASWGALRAEVDASWEPLQGTDLEGCLSAASRRASAGTDEAVSKLKAAMERLRALPEACVNAPMVEEMVVLAEEAARFSDPVHIARIARSLEQWASVWEAQCSLPEE